MPELFYFLLPLSIVAGFWLVWVVVPKIDRLRNTRRIQRGIAECLAQISTKKVSGPGTAANS
jgi:hypothetical protein